MNLDLTDVILFGVETEYSIQMFDRERKSYSPPEIERTVRKALDAALSGHALPFLESHGGYALGNGGRAYWDRLGGISAAEYSTPEVRCPLQACRYVQAGHRFYRTLADTLEATNKVASVEVYLPGVCLQTGHANGVHLNFYRSLDEPMTVLIPHLASLPCISGSGGWATRPFPSLQFVRSPRAELISCISGADSSHNRPLIDTCRVPLFLTGTSGICPGLFDRQ